MQIIDIHMHIYEKVAGITAGAPMTSLTHGRVQVGNEVRQFLPPAFEQSNSTVDTLIAYMDWVGIDKALLMPNPYYGYHNAYFKQAVSAYPERLRGVALVDMLRGEAAAEELAALYDEGILFGFKIETNSTFQCAPGARMSEKRFAPIFDCCQQYRQPIFMHLFTNEDLADLAVLAKAYPDIRFVLCHMGADACFAYRKGIDPGNYDSLLELFRQYPNLYCDTSTVPEYFGEPYPFPKAVEVIERAYRAIGPERMFWASDYPGMLNHATLRQLIDVVRCECRNIPQEHRAMIMGGNAERIFFS